MRQLLILAVLVVSARPAAGQLDLPPELIRAEAERREKAAAPADPEERQQQRRLIYEYGKAETGEQRRMDIVRLAVAKGEPMRSELLAVVTPPFEAQRKRYIASFERAAKSRVAAKLREAGEQRVRELRANVFKARDANDEKKIIELADPAIAELGRLLSIEPGEVLVADPALRKMREDLARAAVKWALLSGNHADDAIAADERGAIEAEIAGRSGARDVYAYNRPLLAQLDPAEAAGIRELNRRRVLLGLAPLKVDPKLVEACRGHSKDMVQRRFFAHDSPVPGKKTPWDRAKLAGTRARAENIAYGSESGTQTIDQWWHSPGHFMNMLGDHTTTGLGRHDKHWTQMFG